MCILKQTNSIVIFRLRDAILENYEKRYHAQLKLNLPKCTEDTSGGLSLEKKHLNAMSLVKYFNALFNKRESAEDKKQAVEEPNTADQAFIDNSEESPKKMPKKKKRPV